MYERLLDKTTPPTFDDLIAYSAENGVLWLELDHYMSDVIKAQREIRFPYGNRYGWSSKYSLKKKHLCDVFAERGAFALHFRISNPQIDSVYSDLSDYAKEICDNKYPCSGGGWLTYRVTSPAHLSNVIKLLSAKLNLK